jgi:hypothetical protein
MFFNHFLIIAVAAGGQIAARASGIRKNPYLRRRYSISSHEKSFSA